MLFHTRCFCTSLHIAWAMTSHVFSLRNQCIWNPIILGALFTSSRSTIVHQCSDREFGFSKSSLSPHYWRKIYCEVSGISYYTCLWKPFGKVSIGFINFKSKSVLRFVYKAVKREFLINVHIFVNKNMTMINRLFMYLVPFLARIKSIIRWCLSCLIAQWYDKSALKTGQNVLANKIQYRL